MGWIIFWAIVALYWAVGIKRMPVYYKRWYDSDRERYSNIHTVDYSQKSAVWTALGVAAFWPYYESGRWLRDHIIHTMTAEERRKQEYEKAEKIVAEYTERREREEREAFDRELRGGA